MPRGYPLVWTDELIEKLKSLYPMHLDTEVAKALGFNYRSVRKKAKELGLTKAEGYDEYFDKTNRRIQRISHVNTRNSGQFQKGHKPKYTFPKGQKQSAELIAKRVATLKKQYYEDSVRMKYGLEPKMKFKRKLRYDLTK